MCTCGARVCVRVCVCVVGGGGPGGGIQSFSLALVHVFSVNFSSFFFLFQNIMIIPRALEAGHWKVLPIAD